MKLRQHILKLAFELPHLRGELLSTLPDQSSFEENIDRLSSKDNKEVIRDLIRAVIQQSIARGKAEARALQPQPAQTQAPVVVVQNNAQGAPQVTAPVDPAIGNLPIKAPENQSSWSAPAKNQNSARPQISQPPAQTGSDAMPGDLRQLHEILERFRVLNNVDREKLEAMMQNVLSQMPDNNLKRRLHSYMETAKHELL